MRSKYALILTLASMLHGCSPTEPDPPEPVAAPTPRPATNPPAPAPTPVPAPTPAPQPTPTPRAPQPPSTTARMEWSISDGCNDGRGLGVKLFDKTNNLVWPNASQYWVAQPGRSVDVAISCQRGARICYGASTDPQTNTSWGVSLEGNRGCDSCCNECGDYRVARTLVCS